MVRNERLFHPLRKQRESKHLSPHFYQCHGQRQRPSPWQINILSTCIWMTLLKYLHKWKETSMVASGVLLEERIVDPIPFELYILDPLAVD